jgi:DNA-binding CsgD family transcriptional regulator
MNASNGKHIRSKGSYQNQPWFDIYTSLLQADREDPLDAEDLYTLSLAAFLTGKDRESTDFLARAHQEFLGREDHKKAIRCAFWLGMQFMFKGEQAKGSGWFSRAQHLLLEVQQECPEKGLLSVPAGLRHLAGGEAEKAYAEFRKAAKAGDNFNDPDPGILGLLGCGQSLIMLGKVSDGVALLDEAMVALEADDIYPIVVGVVYCAVIETCQKIFDVQRAQEWTTVLSEWCDSQPDLVPFRGQCLVRRSQIMEIHGDWSEAMDEMQRACKLLSLPPGEPAAGEAYYALADLHRLRGDLTQAEELYQEANMWGRKPQPGLALLRLAQKQYESAAVSAQNALNEAKNPLQRLKILPAYTEIMLAAGKTEEARLAAGELAAMTEKYQAPLVLALSAYCQGLILLEEGNPGESLRMLRQSYDLWNMLNAPYEAARVRLRMGVAYRKEGDEDSASMELTAAQWVFGQLKANQDLQKAESLIQEKSGPDLHGLTLRELQVLRLVAAGETNKIIAKKLFISEKTVERHVSNIFNKLAVNTRTAATAFALKHKVL